MISDTKTEKRVQCPSCGSNAKRVSLMTLRSLLNDQSAVRIDNGEYLYCESRGEGYTPSNENTDWRFCDSPGCDVVYFAEEGDTSFTKLQLKVQVGVKEASGERPLCYCFGHSVASIKSELQTKGHSEALDDIRVKMKDPGCHCETSNPSGSCCLGSVTKGIQTAQEELGMNNSNVTPVSTTISPIGRGEKIAKIGTIISAIMASACCWLPLLLLAVGVSGVGIAATLEAYRPLFIVVTFGFLGAAFYFTYLPKKVAAATGADCCATEPAKNGDCCPSTGKRQFSMMAVNKVMLWGVTVLAVAFLFFPSYVGALFGTVQDAVLTKDMNRAGFKINGMTCEGCATTVAQTIRQVPGVTAVEVHYVKKQAVVSVDSGSPIPKAEILAALKKAGYSGELLNTEETSDANAMTATVATRSSDGESDAPNALTRQTVLKIDGMTCEGCAAGVSEAISSVPGIIEVQFDFKSGQAIVQSPACCAFPKDAVLSAVRKAGFESDVSQKASRGSESSQTP